MATIRGTGRDDVLEGTAQADRYFGGSGNDWLFGWSHNDMLNGGAGNDTLNGGEGHDVLVGGAGDDTLTFDPGNDGLYGGSGNDLFIAPGDIPLSDPGHDVVDGGKGNDTLALFFGWSWSGAFVDLAAGTASGGGQDGSATLRLAGIENVTGSAFGTDTILGDARDNVLRGFEGNDVIDGRAGNDVLSGDGHDDTLAGGEGNDRFEMTLDPLAFPMTYGNDVIDGGNGVDTIDFSSVLSGVTVDVVLGAASGGADDGSGTVSFSNVENVVGGPYNDTLTGDALGNELRGAAGDDILSGGDGNDLLIGDAGSDLLTGGAGADRFVIGIADGIDTITDFEPNSDQIVLSASDVLSFEGNFIAEDDRFYSGIGATSAHDPTDRVIYDTASGNLYADPDGSGSIQTALIATLSGAPPVLATDITIQNHAAVFV
jgi:Ca2+-binding RTX toxin-like protein